MAEVDRLSFQPDRNNLIQVSGGEIPQSPVSSEPPNLIRCAIPSLVSASPDTLNQWEQPGSLQVRINPIAPLTEQTTNTSSSSSTSTTTTSKASATSNVAKASSSASSTAITLLTQSQAVVAVTSSNKSILVNGA